MLIVGGFLVITTQKKKNQFFIESKNNEINLIKEFNNKQIEIIDKEREQIGAMLHDDLGQSLTLLWFQIEKLYNANRSDTVSEKLFEAVKDSYYVCTKKCKNTSRLLLPSMLINFGLISGLKQLISEMEEITQIKIKFICLENINFNGFVNNNIYRIFQELFNNTLKHGHANNIYIKVGVIAEYVEFLYTDDGKGKEFNLLNHHGLGTMTIKHRLSAVGAKLIDRNTDSNGFIINFILPYEKN